ncbi:MAG: hypothetical protein HQL10_02610 [Nitrospirae bacterium]|nr:hypothetical protein [Nitrospirota bacterium]
MFSIKNVVALALSLVLIAGISHAGEKKIAVLDFEDAATTTQVQKKDDDGRLQNVKINKSNIGRAVTDMLITELVKDGTFKVIERGQIEKVLNEQKFSMSGLVDTAEAAKIGKILGVSAVVVGSVTQYGLSFSSTGILGIGTKTSVAKVAANARMIDTTSAEIITAVEGKGDDSASGFKMGDYAAVDDTGQVDALLGNATRKTVTDIVKQLKDQSAKIKDSFLNTVIAHVDRSNKTFILDAGQNIGIQKDMTMYVIKVTKEITSPTTGQVIRRIVEPIADLKIIGCDKVSADAVCISGKCDSIKEGDKVSSAK